VPRILSLAVLLAAASCREAADVESPEETVELARARQNAPDVLRRYLVSAENSLAVRLRAIRGLAEAGRVDQLRKGLQIGRAHV
jgi:hypothetical protein